MPGEARQTSANDAMLARMVDSLRTGGRFSGDQIDRIAESSQNYLLEHRAALGEVTHAQLRNDGQKILFQNGFSQMRELDTRQALDLDHPASARLLKDRAQVRAILQAIQAVCLGKPGSERERSLPRCTPFCPDGEPEVVFLAPASSESAAFQAFASEVRSASLAVTLARARVSR